MGRILAWLAGRRKKKPTPAQQLENPYRPIYKQPRRVENIRPWHKDDRPPPENQSAVPR